MESAIVFYKIYRKQLLNKWLQYTTSATANYRDPLPARFTIFKML